MKKKPESPYPPGRGTPKILLIMKLTFFLMFVFVLQSVGSVYSQVTKLNLKLEDATVKEVFNTIRLQSDFTFIYAEEEIEKLPAVTINRSEATVEEVIDVCLQKSNLSYEVKDKVIIVKPQEIKQEKKEVKGRVTDSKGNPMVGVSISLVGYNVGTASDANGIFTLPVAESSGEIRLSFIGFNTQKVAYTLGKPLIVKLEEKISDIDEVTVVAYGTQRTEEVTGAISTIESKDIKDLPTANVANLLQGKAAGMSVVNTTGSPGGGGTSITIRGFNSLSVETDRRASEPLWVIDGVPVYSFTSPVTGTNTLSDIDPNDIESIQILKDAASASLYGSRAANGVILVNTKKGKVSKSKLSLNFSQSVGFKPTMSDVTGGVAERRFRMAQLRGVQTAYREKNENGYYEYKIPSSFTEASENYAQYDLFWNKGLGYDNTTVQDSLNPFYNNSTNWFDVYMQAAKTSSLNMSVNGGTEQVRYNVGLGYYDETGVVSGTDYSRINLLSNFQIKPVDKMDIDLRFYIARTDRGRGRQSGYTGIELIALNPFVMSTTLPGGNSDVLAEAQKQVKGVIDDNIGLRLRSSFNVSYELIKNLKISSSLALDYAQAERNYFSPSSLNTYLESQVSNMIEKGSMLLNENLISYKFMVDKHKFDVLGGASFQWDSEISLHGVARGGASDHIHWAVNFPLLGEDANGEKKAMQGFASYKEEKTLIGYFGRVNYVFDEKYLAAITLRRDGSSTFGEDNRWGTFPSGSLGWIVSKEDFMQNFSFLDFMKVRSSWGKTGLHFSQPYLALGVFEPSPDAFLGRSAVVPNWDNGLYNPQLGWEETTQLDLGLDLKLLNNKYEITFDYYHRLSDRMLAEVVLPSLGSYTSYKKQWQNAYSIANEGVELMVKANIINKKDFFWDASINIARNWNRFEGGADGRDFKSGSANISIQGKPLNQLYVYSQDGFYNSSDEVPVYDFIKQKYYYSLYGNSKYHIYKPGDPKYLDLNGDGSIDSDDKVAAGSPLPKAVGGIVNTIKWKNFDFNCLFNFTLSRKILNAALGEGIDVDVNPATGEAHTAHPILLDLNKFSFWEAPGDNADFARVQADPGIKVYNSFTNNMIEDVSYIKLKSIVMGYTFSKLFGGSTSARIYLSGENLFTITNYSGRDPEAVDAVFGVDYAETYPLVKKLTMGVSLNF